LVVIALSLSSLIVSPPSDTLTPSSCWTVEESSLRQAHTNSCSTEEGFMPRCGASMSKREKGRRRKKEEAVGVASAGQGGPLSDSSSPLESQESGL
jgi:hypothetical protein